MYVEFTLGPTCWVSDSFLALLLMTPGIPGVLGLISTVKAMPLGFVCFEVGPVFSQTAQVAQAGVVIVGYASVAGDAGGSGSQDASSVAFGVTLTLLGQVVQAAQA